MEIRLTCKSCIIIGPPGALAQGCMEAGGTGGRCASSCRQQAGGLTGQLPSHLILLLGAVHAIFSRGSGGTGGKATFLTLDLPSGSVLSMVVLTYCGFGGYRERKGEKEREKDGREGPERRWDPTR
jgi:hypothetical protein